MAGLTRNSSFPPEGGRRSDGEEAAQGDRSAPRNRTSSQKDVATDRVLELEATEGATVNLQSMLVPQIAARDRESLPELTL